MGALFERAGSAMTVDRTYDHRIKLEGLTKPLAFMDGASDDEGRRCGGIGERQMRDGDRRGRKGRECGC